MLSATFAALTAIFAKIGVQNVNSDFSTFVRTVLILFVLASIVIGTGQWQPLGSVAARSYLFLGLAGLEQERHGCAIFARFSLATLLS